MGINIEIFNAIKGVLEDYGCSGDRIKRFLTERRGFSKRQADAISILEEIMMAHGKQELRGHVNELARVEHGIRELEPRARDHVVHALLSFLLGIYINEKFMIPLGHGVDKFQWKLAGLFHDVGYPAETARGILHQFTAQINQIKHNIGSTAPDVFFRLTPVGIDQLTNGSSSLHLIQQQLDRWGLAVDVNLEYRDMIDSGRMCHGIMSSLSVLYVIDLKYQQYNPHREHQPIYDPSGISWDQSYFENDVVPACSAIFVHNLQSRCFNNVAMSKQRAPLAFLLRLSDCLQDWNRPSAEKPRGISQCKYTIDITTNGRIVFTVDDAARRQKIMEDLEASLDISDIEVRCPL